MMAPSTIPDKHSVRGSIKDPPDDSTMSSDTTNIKHRLRGAKKALTPAETPDSDSRDANLGCTLKRSLDDEEDHDANRSHPAQHRRMDTTSTLEGPVFAFQPEELPVGYWPPGRYGNVSHLPFRLSTREGSPLAPDPAELPFRPYREGPPLSIHVPPPEPIDHRYLPPSNYPAPDSSYPTEPHRILLYSGPSAEEYRVICDRPFADKDQSGFAISCSNCNLTLLARLPYQFDVDSGTLPDLHLFCEINPNTKACVDCTRKRGRRNCIKVSPLLAGDQYDAAQLVEWVRPLFRRLPDGSLAFSYKLVAELYNDVRVLLHSFNVADSMTSKSLAKIPDWQKARHFKARKALIPPEACDLTAEQLQGSGGARLYSLSLLRMQDGDAGHKWWLRAKRSFKNRVRMWYLCAGVFEIEGRMNPWIRFD